MNKKSIVYNPSYTDVPKTAFSKKVKQNKKINIDMLFLNL